MGKKGISRRCFLGSTAAAGFALSTGCAGPGATKEEAGPGRIMVVGGAGGPAARVAAALAGLGGMERFVKPGMKVALLPNTQKDNPGTFTNPEVLRQVIAMVRAAGASEVKCISWLPLKYWQATGLDRVVLESGAELALVPTKEESHFQTLANPRARLLKEPQLMRAYLAADLLINLPITKHHVGNHFTGALKNAMGINFYKSNRIFHQHDKSGPEHLDQCIADLNLVVTPALSIVDATEIILTNGPFGPGKLTRPEKIVAGVDRVAIDAYCTRFVGRRPEEIVMIRQAHAHGLGEIDLARVEVRDVVL